MGNRERLQDEIAALAARHMAEDGVDCAAAKRKAAIALAGDGGRARDCLPDNARIEVALRAYLRGVVGAPYHAWLQQLRRLAAEWMQVLAPFDPHLVGAVLNGSATRHSHIHLHLYAESAKDVEIALLDRGVAIRVDTAVGADPHAQESIGFVVDAGQRGAGRDGVGVLLTVFDPVGLRVAPGNRARAADELQHPIERSGRADLGMLRRLLAETGAAPATDGAADGSGHADGH
jgi:hypothetical protein